MKRIFLAGSILLFLVACSRQIQVYSDVDPDYDLWSYQTFDWGKKVNIEDGRNPLHYNELTDKQIKQAIRSQLETRGYELSDNNPNLIVHYHIIVEDKATLVTEPYGYNYSPYWLRMDSQVYSYREGTLIVDLMDAESRELIWRGWAVTHTEDIDTPEEKAKVITTVVTRIFKKFPKNSSSRSRDNDVVSK